MGDEGMSADLRFYHRCKWAGLALLVLTAAADIMGAFA